MKTKGLFIFTAIVAMTFTSCEKEEALTQNPTFIPTATGEDPTGGNPNGGGNGGGGNGGGGNGGGGGSLIVGDVPLDFTKKVLIEENTGEWCGWCPYGARIMENIIADNPGKVVGVGVHDGDFMEIPAYNSFQKSTTGVTGFPNGSIDRADASGRSSWTATATSNLALTAELGIAMNSTLTGSMLDLDVYVGYNTPITEATKLTVLIIENDVPQSSNGQAVFDSPSDPLGTMKPLPAGWMHQHALRGVITTDVAGDDISLNAAEKYTKVSFTGVDLSAFNLNNIANAHIAAFVHKNDSPRAVYNVQEADLGELKKWD